VPDQFITNDLANNWILGTLLRDRDMWASFIQCEAERINADETFKRLQKLLNEARSSGAVGTTPGTLNNSELLQCHRLLQSKFWRTPFRILSAL
jgi:hypothetical protein